jgi:cystathionine beta-lyase family protein involved in aluminum resistance
MKLNDYFSFSDEILALDARVMEQCRPYFSRVEEIRDENQLKMLRAFTDNGMAATHMLGSTGYGLWDEGRTKLEAIFAQVLGAEDALVRTQLMSGTHTLTVALFALLRPGDTLLAATGRPYDTLEGVIGLDGKCRGNGTLADYGVKYDEAPLLADNTPDYACIARKAPGAKVCHIQRSRGYAQRTAFDLATIRRIAETAKRANPDILVFVDNCYGEFTQTQEPTAAGADLIAGSLIKNPGGGIAPTGGYIAGKKALVELCACRLMGPSLGKELGCTLDTLRAMYLGFYYAPGVVCEALKTAIYAECLLEACGKAPVPRFSEDHNDIVTCFDAGSAEALVGFCRGIQSASPVDSYAAPEPSEEPGYTDKVVMASGAFTEGSTIELSCDGPLRAPYTCYLQGGLNFAASRAGVLLAVQNAFFHSGKTEI